MEIVSIVNQKGGCAKTTTTVNLAACLADKNKKILLIDNDPQGNLTQALGLKDCPVTIYNCMISDISIQETIIKTNFNNIDIIPADMMYANAELALANVKNKEFLLKEILLQYPLNYDYVLIDCSPSLNLITINALTAADSILIPLEPSIFNLEGLAQLIKVFRLVMSNFNEKLKVKGVLLTRVDSRSSLTKDFKEQLKEIFGDSLFETMIHQNISVVKSQIEKKPLSYYDRSSRAFKEYAALAEEVLKRDSKKKRRLSH